MSTKTTNSELNVSLEPHLAETLRPLVSLLPEELASQLIAVLADNVPSQNLAKNPDVPALIPHSLLSAVSLWARSPSGLSQLSSQNPPLDPHGYSMVALLAGTRTSPERKFPVISSASNNDPQRERSDRRAIVAILNALLSILGSGAATWWAAQQLSWKSEWRVLVALLVAMVVAISEIVLYLIWDAHRSKKSSALRRALRKNHPRYSPNDKVTPDPADGDDLPRSSAKKLKNTADVELEDSYASLNVELHTETRGLRERVPQSSASRPRVKEQGNMPPASVDDSHQTS